MKNLTVNLTKAIKSNFKITVFEIALMGIFLSVAVTSKYFDKFIPHVHPFHIVSLLIGVTILRVIPSIIFISTYVLISSVMFGVEGPTMLASVVHSAESFTLLTVCALRIFKNKTWKLRLPILIGLIIISMALYLFTMIIGDSEYTRVSNPSIPFWERVRLALIYPGDWMNITVSTAISVGVVPTLYLILNPVAVHLAENKWN